MLRIKKSLFLISTVLVSIISISLIHFVIIAAKNHDCSGNYVYVTEITANTAKIVDVAGFRLVDKHMDYTTDCVYQFVKTENIAACTAEMFYAETHYIDEKYGDAYVKFWGRILKDSTPVFECSTDTEPIFLEDGHLMGIHQGAVVEIISESLNSKVKVLVTSVGSWPKHNGWYTWILWIPYDSFDLVRGELVHGLDGVLELIEL